MYKFQAVAKKMAKNFRGYFLPHTVECVAQPSVMVALPCTTDSKLLWQYAKVFLVRERRQHEPAITTIFYRNSVCLSVCLSVRPSVTQVDQSKTVEVRIMQFSPYRSPIPLVFAG